METFWKDLRYAFRMLVKSPGFTLIAMLALGLGIGANTAIFSVFNGMLWRPLLAKDPQQLVVLVSKSRDFEFPSALSYPDFQDYRQLKTVFSDAITYTLNPVNFGAEGRPERAWAELVSGNYFSMLGLDAVRGRTFASDEGWVPGKDPLLVLSYKYWQKRFGGDPAIVGQSVRVNQHPFTIIESIRRCHVRGMGEKLHPCPQWDQRGAGRTYGKSGPSIEPTMTVERMADDGIEVA